MKIKSVTRIIIIEGTPQWVDETIKKSWFSSEEIKNLGGVNRAMCINVKIKEQELEAKNLTWTCCGVTRPVGQRCSCGERGDD